jgi:propanol-preferring alcohol dehydrogenase
MAIPQLQQAAVVENPGDSFTVVLRDNVPVGDPGADEILIKLNCTGIW